MKWTPIFVTLNMQKKAPLLLNDVSIIISIIDVAIGLQTFVEAPQIYTWKGISCIKKCVHATIVE